MQLDVDGRGYLYRCPAAGLRTLQQLLASDPKWAYVFDLAEADLGYCTPELPGRWPGGRAFGARQGVFRPEEPTGLEVRWRLIDLEQQSYDVYVLTEKETVSLPAEGDETWERLLEDVDGLRARDVVLWGEMDRTYSDDPNWMVARIPQVLKHPLKIKREAWPEDPDGDPMLRRVVIRGYDYLAGGVAVATRWAWLQQGWAIPGESVSPSRP